MGVNYTPPFVPYSGQGSFFFWSQKILPLVYDDSLSYYEVLCKVVTFLNNVIQDMDAVEANTEALRNAYNELQGYVNTYFDNLDVQNEINHKLDEMAESGILTDLIEPLVTDERLAEIVDDKLSDVVAEQIDDVVGEQLPGALEENSSTVIAPTITDWLTNNVNPVGSAVVVDSTLTISGAAADAKVTGDRMVEIDETLDIPNKAADAFSVGSLLGITFTNETRTSEKFTQGRYNALSGAPETPASSYWIRSLYQSYPIGNKYIKIISDSNYYFSIVGWKGSTFLGYFLGSQKRFNKNANYSDMFWCWSEIELSQVFKYADNIAINICHTESAVERSEAPNLYNVRDATKLEITTEDYNKITFVIWDNDINEIKNDIVNIEEDISDINGDIDDINDKITVDNTLSEYRYPADAGTVGKILDYKLESSDGVPSAWINGYYTSDHGSPVTSDQSVTIRTKPDGRVNNKTLKIVCDEGYYFVIFGYDENDNYIGNYKYTTFNTTAYTRFWKKELDIRELWNTVSIMKLMLCKGVGTPTTEYPGNYSVEKESATIDDAAHIHFIYGTSVIDDIEEEINNIVPEIKITPVIGSPEVYHAEVQPSASYSETTVDDVYNIYDGLCTDYSLWLTKLEDIGVDSSPSENPIRHYQLRYKDPIVGYTDDWTYGSGTNNQYETYFKPFRILLTAGNHGDEKAGVYGLVKTIREILSNDNEWATFIKANCIIDIIPIINPDGFNNNRRTNYNGEDLNRKYGKNDAQPENIAVQNFISTMPYIDALFDCHTTSGHWGYVATYEMNENLQYVATFATEAIMSCVNDWAENADDIGLVAQYAPFVYFALSTGQGTLQKYVITQGYTDISMTVETKKTSISGNEGKLTKITMDLIGNMIPSAIANGWKFRG